MKKIFIEFFATVMVFGFLVGVGIVFFNAAWYLFAALFL